MVFVLIRIRTSIDTCDRTSASIGISSYIMSNEFAAPLREIPTGPAARSHKVLPMVRVLVRVFSFFWHGLVCTFAICNMPTKGVLMMRNRALVHA